MNIITTQSEPIEFLLRRGRKILITPTVPVTVDEAEYVILDSRLGSQIKLVADESKPAEAVQAPVVTEEVTAPVVTAPVVEAPKVEAPAQTNVEG